MHAKFEVRSFNRFGLVGLTGPLRTDTQTERHTSNENSISAIHYVHLAEISREHWIQRITFAAETNAACSRGCGHTHRRRATQYLRSLSGGEGNKPLNFALCEREQNPDA